jgi:hypothetical protein
MKALTIHQPYAWAILQPGGKNIENRSQAWKYRGPLAVHAGARFSPHGFGEVKSALGFCALPAGAISGAILGVVDLVDVHREADGCCAPWGHVGAVHLELQNPRLLPTPIPCRGQLGLWTPPESALAVLREFEDIPIEGAA